MGSLELDQGQTVAIMGPAKGKKTLLMLLGRVVLPTRGYVAVPDHLRVRFIPHEPIMFQGSLMSNLKIGNKREHSEADIIALCRLFGVHEDWLAHPEAQVGSDGLKLSISDRVFVAIARALLSS